MTERESRNPRRFPRGGPWLALTAASVVVLSGFPAARAETLHLQGTAPRYDESDSGDATQLRLVDLEQSYPWAEAPGAFRWDGGAAAPPDEAAPPVPAPDRRCVLFQCVRLTPPPPAPAKLFTQPVAIWTGAALFIAVVNAAQAPINYGTQSFHTTDESFFQSWTYSGGADKASHFTVSANTAGLLYDAYRLNGLSPDQSFGLSLVTTFLAGVVVEIGDGISPYGFSAQDLTADAFGTLAGTLVKRFGLDDLIWFSLGKIPTTVPVADDTASLGSDYSNEMYTLNFKFAGLAPRVHAQPGFERFFESSFAFFTKGYGYAPPIPTRYQEVGFEVGLNFHEILEAFGVSESTWWGDTLLRAANFVRVPFTQIGAYYNLTNHRWYGPGAPYHYWP
ncbi:MAG TPA: DUF2279 domain-containing protein [Thermoanaerobaculia bacterium]|nr:DUF2279 domain-containing protein [Thermoanaerobaculia bacterium]